MMSSGFHEIWASISSWLQGVDLREVANSSARSCSRGSSRRSPWWSSAGWWCIASGGSSPRASRTRSSSPRTCSRRSTSHRPAPAGDERYLLQLRTVLPPRTVDQLLDNVALRRVMRHLAEQATLTDPVLATEGTAGFEIVNDIVNSVAGSLASSPFPRGPMAAGGHLRGPEGRPQVLHPGAPGPPRRPRAHGILGLVPRARPGRGVVSLLADRHPPPDRASASRRNRRGRSRRAPRTSRQNLLPLVDRQAHHPRVRALSLGINVEEPIIKPPLRRRLGALSPADRGDGVEATRQGGRGAGRLNAGLARRDRPMHQRAAPSRLEQVGGPLGLFGLQAGHDRILAVFDLTSIGAKIVGSVENCLEVERHVGVARQEGDARSRGAAESGRSDRRGIPCGRSKRWIETR